ncbi:fimbria/pilus outer membrane usher protein [Enterobacter wuhouensis]|uniref:Fimbria/pilus outer membrane usher protein n=1 Tax=Enterobacter wuhouensis TaxID=2529381 RepID=A0ABZ1DGE6_9ENTR|nr:fimbria/pilus outer membrane usher protein [Enterobacter wuhouensis]WRW31689.1 fimbria/pilus outer membrane usher protein [Enterobacter wuhouensis]
MKTKLLLNVLLLISPLKGWAALSFDLSALESNGSELSEYTKQQLAQVGQQLPGTYPVEVVLNGRKISTEVIRFVKCEAELCPQMTLGTLQKWGIAPGPFVSKDSGDDDAVLPLHFEQAIPGTTVKLSANASKLILNVPQKYLLDDDANFLASVTEESIPTLFLSYYYSGQRNESAGDSDDQHFVSLNNGINLGAWRLRQSANLVKSSQSEMNWQPTQTYIGRDILSLMSRLMMGQTTTSGRVFDSFNFKGLSLSSIDEMLPDSQRNYAPVIKGIALSQANIEIRQDGNLIYQKSIPAGSFELTDVVPNNSSGDLEVTIRESTGEVRKFIQPYATQPKMVRQGQLRYALSSGRYDNGNAAGDKEIFVQAEGLYGVGNTVSVFSGAMASSSYQSGIAGVGLNLGDFGGISLEIDTSRNKESEWLKSDSGYASKINYSKYFGLSGTSLQASYTQSHERGYFTYADYQARHETNHGSTNLPGNIKRQWQAGLSQELAQFGSLSLNYYSQQSWDDTYNSKTLNASYNTNWKGISAGISYSQSDITSTTRYKDNVLALNVVVPFSSLWGPSSQARINHSYITSRSGLAQNQTTLSGSLLRDNNLNYSLSQTWAQDQTGQAGRIQYDGGSGSVNAAYSRNNNGSRQYSLGSSGSVVFHPGGVTLGQSITPKEPFAIVSAPGAGNVSVTTKSGVKTDSRGYAIVPALTAYRQNSIAIDPTTASDTTSLTSTQTQSTPGFGTAIAAKFGTHIGHKAWVHILYRNRPLSLGTELFGKNGASGIVDDKGYAWITGLTDGEQLNANVDGRQCRIHIHYNRLVLSREVYTGAVECQ